MVKCVICKRFKSLDENGEKIHYFRFPKPSVMNPYYMQCDIFNKWLDCIPPEMTVGQSNDDIYNKYVICSNHFNKDDIIDDSAWIYLKKNAVPLTVYASTDEDTQNVISGMCSASTSHGVSSIEGTIEGGESVSRSPTMEADVSSICISSVLTGKVVRKRKSVHSTCKKEFLLRRKCINLKKKLERVKRCLHSKTMESYLNGASESASLFFKAHMREASKKRKGRRYTSEEKILCLSLYKQSAKSYRTLATIFNIPSERTILHLLQQIPIESGINEVLTDFIKTTATKLKDVDKNCALLFDEVFLMPDLKYNQNKKKIIGFEDMGEFRTKKFADHALVFLLRGLFKKWKLPLCYYFCQTSMKKDNLLAILRKVVDTVAKTGLKIRALICDQGSNNCSVINILKQETKIRMQQQGVQYSNEFIEIAGIKVVHFYDPPHLIKGIRNNFLKSKIKFSIGETHGIAKWEHIMAMYEYEKKKNMTEGFYGVPKLCDYYVIPHKIRKMKVKYATPIFSQRVASYMKVLADLGGIVQEGNETSRLILFFDELFDSINGKFDEVGAKKLRCACKSNSGHIKFWRYAISILEAMRFCDLKNQTPPSLLNWINTLKSFIYLREEFKKERQMSFYPGRINQDPIENFFSSIRGQGHFNLKQTVSAFELSFKTLVTNNMRNKHSINANCEDDETIGLIDCVQLLLREAPRPEEGKKGQILSFPLISVLLIWPQEII